MAKDQESKVRIMKATSVEYYHAVPSDLEILTISPEQSAIFQYLSAVDPNRFQEFVADVLVHVGKHELIDITGGPGDEKQDILTKAPDGLQQLTQCKHTINPGGKTSGDELDLLLPAALRKNCKHALYVTNADLTPQAKRYVNDREYLRGSKIDPTILPTIDYWNGRRLWERVANNVEILNKWFSGAAQVHGLRTILCHLIATSLPNRVIQDFGEEKVRRAFDAMGTPFNISADESFSSLRDVPGSAGHLPLDSPIPALRVQLGVSPAAGIFDIDSAISKLAEAALSTLRSSSGWNHLFLSAPTAVFFVHDLGKPVLSYVAKPCAFVQIGQQVEDEVTWAFDPGAGFTAQEDDDLCWTHPASGAQWNGFVDQSILPHESYAAVLRQRKLIQSAADMTFWRFESNRDVFELLQSLSGIKEVILQEGDHHLLFAFPSSEQEGAATRLAAYCSRNDLHYQILTKDESGRLLALIEEMPEIDSKMVSKRHELESPIDLMSRAFLLEIKAKLPTSMSFLIKVLRYKWKREAEWGFDAYMGEETKKVGSEELLGRLFDIQTIRAQQMLDITPSANGELLLYLRRIVSTTDRASTVARSLLQDLQQVQQDLQSLADE